MRAVITITQTPDGNVILVGEGDFNFDTHKETLVARASIAAVEAASAIIDEEGGFHDPIVEGADEAVKMANIKNAKRLPAPEPNPGITFLDGTSL